MHHGVFLRKSYNKKGENDNRRNSILILERISAPDDIRKIDSKDYDALAAEIRAFLLEKISQNGGHLSSNLGTVELTMALFLSFAPPKDKIIWDVGHQSYTHKILSGRRKEFDGLRTFGGIAGFPKSSESSCDAFNTGHSSTSISAGLGIVQARDVLHEDFSVVSVIGDGALTGGMAYEALNNASRVKKNFIIVLNDNRMPAVSLPPLTGRAAVYSFQARPPPEKKMQRFRLPPLRR